MIFVASLFVVLVYLYHTHCLVPLKLIGRVNIGLRHYTLPLTDTVHKMFYLVKYWVHALLMTNTGMRISHHIVLAVHNIPLFDIFPYMNILDKIHMKVFNPESIVAHTHQSMYIYL